MRIKLDERTKVQCSSGQIQRKRSQGRIDFGCLGARDRSGYSTACSRSGKSMPNQLLPAPLRCGVAFALLLLPLATGCGREREPWYGFELFPTHGQPPDGTAGTSSTDASTTDFGGTAADAPQQSSASGINVGTASNAEASAANGGGTPAGSAASDEPVNTGTPATSNGQDGAMQGAMPAGPP